MFGFRKRPARPHHDQLRWEDHQRYDIPKTLEEIFWRQDRRMQDSDRR
ncbi:MAG: hypothetical protein HRU32_12620 [Rhodobacteraceae bacterium]|nr:hypothetical protein [Paracoccaceae bacterium]